MVKNKYLILVNGNNEFCTKVKVTNKKRKYTFRRSNEKCWTNPGEKLFKIVDDGDGITINDVHYDYGDFADLFLAMKTLMHDQGSMWAKYEIIETNTNRI